jgi:hypothetical protein
LWQKCWQLINRTYEDVTSVLHESPYIHSSSARLDFRIIGYGSAIWSNTSARKIKKLQTAQNVAAGYHKIRKFDHLTPTSFTCTKLDFHWIVTPVQLEILLHVMVTAGDTEWVSILYSTPNNLTNMFTRRSDMYI